ncbi:MAG: helix-turn-helix domain-containing protein [Synergistaceae bacterium]|nr:helix-turn-helix domain-containing protein [Synergistaceae bacterium]
MNRQRLKGEIIAKYGTQDAFAEAIGWHRNKVPHIMTGRQKPDTDEVSEITRVLGLSEQLFVEIFLHAVSPNRDRTGNNGEVCTNCAINNG